MVCARPLPVARRGPRRPEDRRPSPRPVLDVRGRRRIDPTRRGQRRPRHRPAALRRWTRRVTSGRPVRHGDDLLERGAGIDRPRTGVVDRGSRVAGRLWAVARWMRSSAATSPTEKRSGPCTAGLRARSGNAAAPASGDVVVVAGRRPRGSRSVVRRAGSCRTRPAAPAGDCRRRRSAIPGPWHRPPSVPPSRTAGAADERSGDAEPVRRGPERDPVGAGRMSWGHHRRARRSGRPRRGRCADAGRRTPARPS